VLFLLRQEKPLHPYPLVRIKFVMRFQLPRYKIQKTVASAISAAQEKRMLYRKVSSIRFLFYKFKRKKARKARFPHRGATLLLAQKSTARGFI